MGRKATAEGSYSRLLNVVNTGDVDKILQYTYKWALLTMDSENPDKDRLLFAREVLRSMVERAKDKPTINSEEQSRQMQEFVAALKE